MPASIKLQEEYGDDLAVIFVESQGVNDETAAKFVMKRRWLSSRAMWTTESPFSTGSRTLPSFAILGPDGTVLAKGSHMDSRHKDLIEEQVALAKGAPEGTHKSFKKAWKTFNKGSYGKALLEVNNVGMKKPELAGEATALVAVFEGKVQSKIDRSGWLLENGYPAQGKDLASSVVSSLKGVDDLLAVAVEMNARFDTDEAKLELEAAAKIDRLQAKVIEDGRDEKLFQKLSKLADKYDGTQVGKRARGIAKMGG